MHYLHVSISRFSVHHVFLNLSSIDPWGVPGCASRGAYFFFIPVTLIFFLSERDISLLDSCYILSYVKTSKSISNAMKYIVCKMLCLCVSVHFSEEGVHSFHLCQRSL